MAVALEFIDFVVRVETIRAKYLGGWEACLADHARILGHRVWYDEHLLRDGAMNPRDIARLLDEWEALGFVPTETVGGVLRFRDVCVVETLLGGARLPCDWLEVDWERRAGFLKGTAPGPVVGGGPTRLRGARIRTDA
ncbi:MAG: hypothetical protein ABI349_07775 [Casimicrobiaceae bacterium]